MADRLILRNRRAFTLQGVLFFTGIAFFDTSTVLPLFLQTWTGSSALVGVAVAIRQFATLLVQVLFGLAVERTRHVPRYLTMLLFASYSAPFLTAGALAAGWDGSTVVAVLFAALAVQWICDGFLVIGYYDLLSRTLPAPERARALGWQQALGGAGAVGAAVVIKAVLDQPGISGPQKYLTVFLIGGAFLMAAAAAFSRARDVEHRLPRPREPFGAALAQVPGLWRSRPRLRRLLICQGLVTLAMACAPFVLVMARVRFGLPESQVTLLLNLQVAGAVAGGLLVTLIGPRIGNRRLIRWFAGLLTVGLAAGLAAPLVPELTVAALAVLAVGAGFGTASWAAFLGAVADEAEGRVPLYFLANSLSMLPLSAAVLGAGLLADAVGFGVVLVVGFAFAVGGWAASVRRDPREVA